MQIIVVGAGKVGTSLTAQLIQEHRVTVIDQEPRLIENIINVYDVMGVCGNGASYEVQKEAEVGKADLLIATTSSDEINILACLVHESEADGEHRIWAEQIALTLKELTDDERQIILDGCLINFYNSKRPQ